MTDTPDTVPPTIEDYATMAAAFLWAAYEGWCEWEPWDTNGPDIGQYDFDRIIALMGAMLPTDPKKEKITAAYDRFAARAKEFTDGD